MTDAAIDQNEPDIEKHEMSLKQFVIDKVPYFLVSLSENQASGININA